MKFFSTPFLRPVATALVLLLALASAAQAQQTSKEQLKGLDEQVQDIKKDVLAISSELLQLEEKLLYPSNTQVSLFVSLAAGASVQIDSVKLRIDGADAANHVYTYKEVEALRGGGVQRIHTANVRGGEHVLEVSLIGKTGSGADYRHSATYRFKKAVEPKLLEIVLGGSGAPIQFKE